MKIWKSMAAVAAAAGLALALTGCGGGSGSDTSCNPSGGAGSSASAAQTVKVVNDPNTVGKYDPQSVSVKAGDSVQWQFADDSAKHSVTEDNSMFDSCLQAAGATFTVTFSKAGDYKYHCTIHSGMTGEIKVS